MTQKARQTTRSIAEAQLLATRDGRLLLALYGFGWGAREGNRQAASNVERGEVYYKSYRDSHLPSFADDMSRNYSHFLAEAGLALAICLAAIVIA